MDSEFDFNAMRREYSDRGLRRADLLSDPLEQLEAWFALAVREGVREPNVVCLATVTPAGQPRARMVLYKGLSGGGLTFFTNYEGDKARELEAAGRASLCFFWWEQERQVRADGAVERVSEEESAKYFAKRPRGSRIAAWASDQSCEVSGRAELEASAAEIERRFAGQEVPCPPFWGGYRLVPETMEFWQGRANRLHDRFRYSRVGSGWRIARLAP